MLHLYLKALRTALPFIIPMIVVILLVGFWTRRIAKKKQGEALTMMKQAAQPDPLAEAQARYAKGEITASQYEAIKSELTKN